MSSAAKFQALAASSKSADRLRNQTMFKPDLSKIVPEALSAHSKDFLRCVLASIMCKLPLAVEVVHGVSSAPASALQPAPAAHVILAALKQIFDCVFISCSAQDILASASSSFEQYAADWQLPQPEKPVSERRGSLSSSSRAGSSSTTSRAGSSSTTKPPKKDAIKVLFVSDVHSLSRQAQLQLSLLLLSDAYSIPAIFIVSGAERPLQCLRYSLRGKFRISATIGAAQLAELSDISKFANRMEQDGIERLRKSIEEPGSVEFCLELEAYVHDVVFGLRNQPDGTCGPVRFPASTLKTLSRAVASIAGREFAVPEDVHDAALLFLPLAFRSSQMQISEILNV